MTTTNADNFMSNQGFTFRPMSPGDQDLVTGWIEATHVRRWWMDAWSAVEDGQDGFIAEIDGKPAGYLRAGWALREPDGFWDGVEGVTDDTRAIVFLIGEEDLVNRKHGRVMLNRFAALLFEDQRADRIVAAPQRDNWPANIALKRAGFRDRGAIGKPGVNAMLLSLARGVFKPLAD